MDAKRGDDEKKKQNNKRKLAEKMVRVLCIELEVINKC